METVDIQNVEVLRVGRWNGREYSITDLDNLVDSFGKLEGEYKVPGKLGHNDKQALLIEDGLPAAGWVNKLYRRGTKLVADFTDIPKKVAELIKANGYRSRSCEIWFNTKFGDNEYPAVLKAVSWLGVDAPAVSGLNDILAYYSDEDSRQVTVVTLAYNENENAEQMCEQCPDDCAECGADCEQCHNKEEKLDNFETPETIEQFRSSVLNEFDGMISRLNKVGKGQKGITALKTLLGEARTKVHGFKIVPEQLSMENGEMDEAKLRSLLGIDETVDIEQTIIALKAQHVSLSEHTELQSQYKQLETRLDERDADDFIGRVLNSGKLVPAQEEWAKDQFLKNRTAMLAWENTAPVVVDLSQKGSDSDTTEEDTKQSKKITPEMEEVAKKFGNSLERLSETKTFDERILETATNNK